MSSLGLILAVGLCIGLGQTCFALLVRGVSANATLVHMAGMALASPWFYATAGLYAAGLVAYGLLLRQETLVSGNVSVIVVIILLNVLTSAILGETLTGRQWLGVALALSCLVFLRS